MGSQGMEFVNALVQKFKLEDQKQVALVSRGFIVAVSQSFRTNPPRIVCNDNGVHVKNRVRICTDVFEKLRGDHGWSVRRIIDNLPKALQSELDGKPFEPVRDRMWAGKKGQAEMVPDGFLENDERE